MTNYEVFEIPGDRPRRLTQENTLETRENWFKIFETSEVIRLRNSLPHIPSVPEHPGAQQTPQLLRPVYWIAILLCLLIAGIATGYKSWLVISHYLLVVISFIFETKTPTHQKDVKKILKSRLGLLGIFWGIWSSALAYLVAVADLDRGWVTLIDLISCGIVFQKFINPWLTEKNEIAEKNALLEKQLKNYESDVAARQRKIAERDELERKLESLSIECLHYRDMVKIRRDLLDKILVEAFADLGVSEEVQREILADRDKNILEMSGPIESSSYERSIVEFKTGVLPWKSQDSPILRNFLSHLYACKIAIILPQGLGTFDVVIDAVTLDSHKLGNQLTMWKSISRVNREIQFDDWQEEKIVLETYGGTKTDLEVNGISVKENRELIPIIEVNVETQLGDSPLASESKGRMVNSFVLAIQQKMSEQL
jgi:hypothetical protein